MTLEPGGATKELRLALVLYGGVSLAIYMHGITKELNKLVAASRALDLDDNSPFPGGTTEDVYFGALKRLRDRTGIRTQVVVDIISGTSAGGINGVYLAKALARNVRQDELSKLWLEKGDIAQLVRGGRVLGVFSNWKLRLLRNLKECLDHPEEDIAPLRGDVMCQWYWQALNDMDGSQAYVSDLATLMPPHHDLQLFVTITDFYGYRREIPIESPRLIVDSRHRHVFEFRRDTRDTNHFSGEFNDGLAFASRGTSSFPGAFPAISFSDFEACFQPKHDLADFDREFCRAYALTGESARDTHFIDGGVLDNFPFDHAVHAIKQRQAFVEVDRRLLYVEPDPRPPAQSPRGLKPGWLATVWSGLSSIPSNEPILDQLLELMTFNDNVRAIRDIIEVGFDDVRRRVTTLAGPLLAEVRGESKKPDATATVKLASLLQEPPEHLEALRRAITDAAHEGATTTDGYPTYVRIKIESVVDSFAELVSAVLEFPSDSNHAFFVRRVFRAWARAENLFVSEGVPTDDQKRFLKSYDVQYERRLLRFLIAAVNWWYRPPAKGEERPPDRDQLDAAKVELYSAVAKLDELVAGRTVGDDLKAQLERVFSVEGVRDALRKNGLDPTGYIEEHGSELEQVRIEARTHIESALDVAGAVVPQKLAPLAKDWPESARRDLVARYLGFPFWDIMLYPVQALADAGEGDEVQVMRVSPLDSHLLHPPSGEKLQGVAVHHFGAFFHPEARANDYLWGRLDAVERLLGLLLAESNAGYATECADGFEAVLNEERELELVEAVRNSVSDQIGPIRQLACAAEIIDGASPQQRAELADELNHLIGGALTRLDETERLGDAASLVEAEGHLQDLLLEGLAGAPSGSPRERIETALEDRPLWPFVDVPAGRTSHE